MKREGKKEKELNVREGNRRSEKGKWEKGRREVKRTGLKRREGGGGRKGECWNKEMIARKLRKHKKGATR